MQPFRAGAARNFGKGEFRIVGWISDDFCKAASLPRIKTKTSILVLALDTERWIFIPKKKRGTSLEVAGLCNRSRV